MSDPAVDYHEANRTGGHQEPRRSACTSCRKRRVKCIGAKPSCRNCLRLNNKCQWPGDNPKEDEEKINVQETIDDLLNTMQRSVLIDIFLTTPHLVIIRQSILPSTLENKEINQETNFFFLSIYCLSALYVPESAVRETFNGESAASISQRLATAAQRYSRDTSDQPSVASTQANLVLGLRELLCRTGYKAWMYIGLAIRMSQALRLGREYHQKYSTREQEIRRRTMWTCFIMDRLVSSVCSRPLTLRSTKLGIQLPCPETNFEFDEISQGPLLTLETGPNPKSFEVLPYFIKAIEHWGIMYDLFASGVNGPPSQAPSDPNSEFCKAEQAVMAWKDNLPLFMRWTWKNYKSHRRFGQGSLFVSLHFIINHALCIAHQEYLPEFEGDPAFEDVLSLESSYNHTVVRTCLSYAEEITRMASTLYSGDASDREMLQAPFIGLALESAACCHLWRIHQIQGVENTNDADDQSNVFAKQKLQLLCNIMKSWENVWPLSSAWQETIDLLSKLYEASHRDQITAVDDNVLHSGEESRPPASGDISIGSGYPHPQNINSYRLFDNIRLIRMTTADPSSLRHRQTRLHIEVLWARMRMIKDIVAAGGANDDFHLSLPALFDNIIVEELETESQNS